MDGIKILFVCSFIVQHNVRIPYGGRVNWDTQI